MNDLNPTEIKKTGDRTMGIVWNDGVECEYSYRLLRKACPCATCKQLRGETKEKKSEGAPPTLRLISSGAPSADPKLVKVDWVGNYALKLSWDDGHDTGIYDFEFLRSLCGKSEEDLEPAD